MRTPTAAWPLDTLVGSLQRAGWGLLEQERPGCRTVLNALVAVLPHGSAAGKITLGQLSDVTGLKSHRWISGCLRILQRLGLIEWTPGWVDHGKPRPGHVRVIKTALAIAVRAARRQDRNGDRARSRAAELRTRLQQSGRTTLTPQKPLSVHASLSDALPFHREVTSHHGAGRTSPQEKSMTETLLCIHGFSNPNNCPDCTPRPPSTPGRPPTHPKKCGVCYRSPAAHHAANSLVPPHMRHEWRDA